MKNLKNALSSIYTTFICAFKKVEDAEFCRLDLKQSYKAISEILSITPKEGDSNTPPLPIKKLQKDTVLLNSLKNSMENFEKVNKFGENIGAIHSFDDSFKELSGLTDAVLEDIKKRGVYMN